MLFLLGLVDIACAISLLLSLFGFPIPTMQAGAALLLAGKAFLFIGDFLSIVDIVAAVLMIVLLWVHVNFLIIGLAAYLGVKGTLSLF